jgi:hypothetical protein
VTPAEKQSIDHLHMISWIGIPFVLGCGALLHFLLGVKLYPGTPTLAEWRNRKRLQSPPPTATG